MAIAQGNAGFYSDRVVAPHCSLVSTLSRQRALPFLKGPRARAGVGHRLTLDTWSLPAREAFASSPRSRFSGFIRGSVEVTAPDAKTHSGFVLFLSDPPNYEFPQLCTQGSRAAQPEPASWTQAPLKCTGLRNKASLSSWRSLLEKAGTGGPEPWHWPLHRGEVAELAQTTRVKSGSQETGTLQVPATQV